MAIDIRVITLNEREQWEAAAAESGVPSHSWSFCSALSHSGPSPKLARLSSLGNLLIIPFLERNWAETVDISTITSVSGATMCSPDPALLDLWSEHARSEGWVAGYLQFAPETDLSQIPNSRAGNVVFLMDLRDSDFVGEVSQIIRRKLRRAVALGVQLVDDRRRLAEAIVPLYRATMMRTRARIHYRYVEETLRSWVHDPRNLVIGAELSEGIAACALFLVNGSRAEYHLGASSESGRGLQAWLLNQGMRRLRELGVTILNFGGGISPGDGLFQFKAKFGGQAQPIQAVRQIYRSDVYKRLSREAHVSPNEPWFPAYRASVDREGFQ
jgi:hypothetical protein